MVTAGTPILVPRAGFSLRPPSGRGIVAPRPRRETGTLIVTIRTGALPSALALAEAEFTCLVSRVKELAALEPLHHRRCVLLAQPVERRQQLFGIMGAEGGGLVVDDDGPGTRDAGA